MKYHCFRCGNILTKRKHNLYKCKVCNYEHFVDPYPTTSVIIINEKDEIMLVKRKFPPKKGFWDLPGGFVDIGETGEDGARREIKEELGLTLNEIYYLGALPDKYLFQGINLDTLTLSYYSKITNAVIKISDDITGYKFFNEKDIPYNKLAFKNLSVSIKKYLGIKRNMSFPHL